MTPASLQRLISHGEGSTLEFKRSTGELREGLEALCAFLNTAGRRVLFGVRRNELIADVFYRRGFIEKRGRGTQKIIELDALVTSARDIIRATCSHARAIAVARDFERCGSCYTRT